MKLKAEAEKVIFTETSSCPATCAIRPACTFGPNDPTTIPAIKALIDRGETPFILGDGANMFDFV
jgi:sterol-4alpha-carboxylate 3-dehydrogenase (decarboxylating)